MHWQFSPDTVLNEFAGDWSRLVAHPFVCATAHREPSSGKGQFQSVDLSNVKTFIATYGKNRGSFIPVYKREHDLAWQWAENLRLASERETISEEIVHELRDRFDAFAKVYSAALKGLTEEGLNHSDLPEQLRAYTSLLNAVNHLVKGDRGRDLRASDQLRRDDGRARRTNAVYGVHPRGRGGLKRRGDRALCAAGKIPQPVHAPALCEGEHARRGVLPIARGAVSTAHHRRPDVLAVAGAVPDVPLVERDVDPLLVAAGGAHGVRHQGTPRRRHSHRRQRRNARGE